MAGMIPQSFIHELLARVDLVNVIEKRVNLKKAGRNYQARCPFHNEKTPSFSVNPDKQFYYCFGCGASGNAISFLMEYEGQEFVAAIEDLAASIGLPVPRDALAQTNQFDQNLFEVMQKVSQYYQQQLKQHPEGKTAVNYLKNRGLTGEIAKQYGIGYAPAGWQNLLTLSKEQEKFQKDLITTGMMIKNDNGKTYDRFRERIMFPIRNRRGQVIGFGGRIIDQGEPKYLNSPETPLFHKSNALYGIYEMRRQLRDINQIIVVEGYMDVVSLAQYGIYNCVATLGTATTEEHIQTLFRMCPTIVFCFDGDKAGRAAALKALNQALPLLKETREVRLMFLPEGEDPDTMVRNHGKDEFSHQVENSVTLFDYLIDYLTGQVDMNTFEGPAKLVHLAKPYLQAITDQILLMRFKQRLSELSSLPLQQLDKFVDEASPIHQKNTTEIQPPAAEQKPSARPDSANKHLFRRTIALLLQYPQSLPDGDYEWLENLEEAAANILNQLIKLITNNEKLTTAILVENWRDKEEEKGILKLANMDLHTEEQGVTKELTEIFSRLKKLQIIEQWDRLIEKSRLGYLSEEEKLQLKQLQVSMTNLSE